MEAVASELHAAEETLVQTPSPTRQPPRKAEDKGLKYMIPYTQPNASPIRLRFRDSSKSDIWPDSKPLLMDEYCQIRNGDIPGKYVKDMAAYYKVHKDYFKGNIRQLRQTKTLKGQKFKCGRKAKWTPEVDKLATEVNKQHHRRAGSRTLAVHLPVCKTTVNNYSKKEK